MNSKEKSFNYLEELINIINKNKNNQSKDNTHPTSLTINESTKKLYTELYEKQKNRKTNNQLLKQPPNNETCANCKKHYYNNRPKIRKNDDLSYGKIFELSIMSFINHFNFHDQNGINCTKGDSENFHLPDLIIQKNGKIILSLEIKYIEKPFLSISKRVSSKYRCYSHSLTLDSSKKLEHQINSITDRNFKNVVYVYLYDVPCIKGIFWVPDTIVNEIKENSPQYERKSTEGDFDMNGRQNGTTEKIYIPITRTGDFYSLMAYIYKLSKNS